MSKVRKTAYLKALARTSGEWREVPITDEMRAEHPHLAHCKHIWANNRLECQGFDVKSSIGGVWQFNLIRHGDIERIGWEEIQRTVHELFGPEVTAVEIYPPIEHEWRTNLGLRVLWILPSSWQLPFGLEKPGSWGKPVA